jgi:hypothetical protein
MLPTALVCHLYSWEVAFDREADLTAKTPLWISFGGGTTKVLPFPTPPFRQILKVRTQKTAQCSGGFLISTLRTLTVIAALCIITLLATAQSPKAHSDWHARLQQELPLMGHRNWIAIVDSAYPLQISPGIETIETDGDQLDLVRRVLHEISETKHVRPVVFTDAELKVVPEEDALGVTYYRDSLNHFFEAFNDGKTEMHSLPHEEIISRLDDAGKTFHVLVLKSTLTIPYTSVFIRLDCGYWTEEQEKRLREKMGKK